MLEMPRKHGEGTLIVQLREDAVETEELTKRLLSMEGVHEAEFSHFTRKLRIAHDGSDRVLKLIQQAVKPYKRIKGHLPE